MKKKYVQVGLGGRARFFYEAIASTYHQTCELVGFCDVSQTRMDYANRILVNKYGQKKVKTCMPSQFEQLLDDVRPAEVIITSVDRTHHDYIIRAMKKGYDVICEKPLTIDEEKAQEIITVQKQTGRSLRVTFNYRYAPYHTKIKELIESDVIGDVFSIHFEWLLNTQHGADYFRRWHRNKHNSGGLLVHKSTHHFDLVNFWLNSRPQKVFAFGGLNFYGMHNAEKRGVEIFYSRCYGSELAKADPFAIDLSANEELREMY
ncbi:Gfo/Idh/MocA family oxidoreductase, partial [Enterococcus faecium]